MIYIDSILVVDKEDAMTALYFDGDRDLFLGIKRNLFDTEVAFRNCFALSVVAGLN